MGSPAVLASASTSNEKGPKSFFRLRVLPCRQLVALLAVGLCVLAGEAFEDVKEVYVVYPSIAA